MIQTDNDPKASVGLSVTDLTAFEQAVAQAVQTAITTTIGSKRAAATETGIAYTTLDRKLRCQSSFTTYDLHRLARITGRRVRDFIPTEVSS